MEWRNVLIALILFPLGTGPRAAQQDHGQRRSGSSGELVRLTLDVSWGMPRSGAVLPDSAPAEVGSVPDAEFVLEMSEGRVVDALAGHLATRDYEGRSRRLPRTGADRAPKGAGGWGKSPRGAFVFRSKRRSRPALLFEAATRL